MMAKPMKTLELHYPMIQFLVISIIMRVKKDRLYYYLWLHGQKKRERMIRRATERKERGEDKRLEGGREKGERGVDKGRVEANVSIVVMQSL